MVLSRPVLIALVGGVISIAALLTVRTLSGGEDTEALPSAGSAGAVFAGPTEVRSGRLAVRLVASDLVGGSQGARGKMELSGAFQAQGPGETPKFDLRLSYDSPADSGSFGIVSTGDRGFVTENRRAYELPSEAWAQITALRGQAAGAPSGSLDLGGLATLENRRAAPGPAVDGVATERVTGDVDVRAVLRALSSFSQLTGDAGASLGRATERDIASVVESARVESITGDDGVLRSFELDLRLAVPARLRERTGGFRSGRVRLALELSGVNEPQVIGVPKRIARGEPSPEIAALAAPMLAAGTLAIDPPEAAAPPQPAAGAPAADPAPAAGDGVPSKVAQALDRKKIVVLLFTQDGGDDAATRASVREIRRLGDRGVAVFQDSVTDLADYRRVVSDLGITRAPAIVVVGPDRTARVLEGYTDSGTLAQAIRDLR